MIDKFLKAKHWQLFLLTYGIPTVLQGLLIGQVFSGSSMEDGPDFDSILAAFSGFAIIMVIVMVVFFGWFWSVGVGLNKQIPDDLKLNVGKFKLALIFPLVYLIGVIILVITLLPAAVAFIGGSASSIFAIIIPIHLVAICCLFYSLYFVAKTIKTAELQREVTFGDYVAEFFLLGVFPIGIWLIQPTINRIAMDDFEDDFDGGFEEEDGYI